MHPRPAQAIIEVLLFMGLTIASVYGFMSQVRRGKAASPTINGGISTFPSSLAISKMQLSWIESHTV